MKNEKRTHILTTLVCLIPLIVGAVLYSRFPEQMAIHWDGDGVANGFAPRYTAVFVLPGSLLLLNLVMPFLMKTDPKYENMDPTLRRVILWIIPVVDLFASATTMSMGLGYEIPISRCGMFLFGVLFIVIGNYLPKTKQSYTMGIKLPWTLHSEENWNRTHRMTGYLWVSGGVFTLLGAIFALPGDYFFIIFALLVVIPCVYSYMLYRKGI